MSSENVQARGAAIPPGPQSREIVLARTTGVKRDATTGVNPERRVAST
jgi:hypothetical protein